MHNIEQIVSELLSIDSGLTTDTARFQQERQDILDAMNKAQSMFGDQKPGQLLVTTLYGTMQNMITAENSLYLVKQKIHECIENMKK